MSRHGDAPHALAARFPRVSGDEPVKKEAARGLY